MTLKLVARLSLLGVAAAAASGCGVLRNDTYGALLINIEWPEATRSIPSYARSARIVLNSPDDFGGGWNDWGNFNRGRQQIVSRSQDGAYSQEIRFDDIVRRAREDLPYYEHFVEVLFYTGSGGTGSVVATARYTFRYRDFNWTHDMRVAPFTDSELVALRYDGSPTLPVNTTRALVANGVDGFNRTIALPPRALNWELISGAGATLTPDGTLNATQTGTVTVRVTEVDNSVDPLTFTINVVP